MTIKLLVRSIKTELIKLRLCSALLKSHADDVSARGGADLPRRSLCNAFTLLFLKPVANFKTLYMFSTWDKATLQHGRFCSSSSPRQYTCVYWSWKAVRSGLVKLEANNWPMHPRSLHPHVCSRCGVSSCCSMEIFYELLALNFANQLVAMSFPTHLVLKPLSP